MVKIHDVEKPKESVTSSILIGLQRELLMYLYTSQYNSNIKKMIMESELLLTTEKMG